MNKNWLDDAAEETATANAAEFDKLNTPEARNRLADKIASEHERGVRNGWWDENGEPLESGQEEE